MLHPTSPRRRYWDLFIALNLVYTMLFLPVRICFNITAFDDYNYGWWVESVVNMVFLVDLFMNLSTGVYVKVVSALAFPKGRDKAVFCGERCCRKKKMIMKLKKYFARGFDACQP